MPDGNSTPFPKPSKPYPEFPLYAHASGRWAKKIRGKTHFFGCWREPHQALTRYLAERGDLEAGRKPQRASLTPADALTVEQMVSLYIEAKKLCVDSGEMGRRTLQEYRTYGMRMIRVFGANTPVEQLGPQDFKRYRADIQKTHKSLSTLAADVRKTLVYFNWAGPGAHGQGLIDRLPRFGDSMRAPSTAALARERDERGARVFTAAQLRRVLAAANTTMRAMIFLGINCGYGNTDCVKVSTDNLDLVEGWATLPRSKTSIRRKCPLWPETIEALKRVLRTRRKPDDRKLVKLVFINMHGGQYRARNLSRELGNALERAKLGRDAGDFYDLRRTCASIGIRVSDDDAVRTIMGHRRSSTDMLGVYNRLSVSDKRLCAVTDHIHAWLFTRPAPLRAPLVFDDASQSVGQLELAE